MRRGNFIFSKITYNSLKSKEDLISEWLPNNRKPLHSQVGAPPTHLYPTLIRAKARLSHKLGRIDSLPIVVLVISFLLFPPYFFLPGPLYYSTLDRFSERPDFTKIGHYLYCCNVRLRVAFVLQLNDDIYERGGENTWMDALRIHLRGRRA